MRLRRVRAVFRRHLVETIRNPDRIADVLLWPFLDVVTWGVFSRYLVHGGAMVPARPVQLVGGIVLWGVFRAFQRDVAVGVLAEIWSRNLASLLVSPVSFAEYFAGLVSINLAKLMLALMLIVAVCRVLTGAPDLALLLGLAPALMILLFAGSAVGLVVTALIVRVSTRVQTLAYGLAGIAMPLSCVFYPLTALPAPLRAVAIVLPTTYVFEAMRAIMAGGGGGALLWRGLGLAVVYLAGAILFFRASIAAARRSGRLMRLD